MKHIRREFYLLLWLTAGWLLAAVGTNRLFAAGLVNYQVLYGYVVQGWADAIQGEPVSVLKIILMRLGETVLITAVCRSRLRGPGIVLILAGAGLSAGVSMVLLTWCRGVMGIVCFLIAGFPQDLFYLAAWGVLILKYAMSYEVRRGKFWSMVVSFLMIGICAEIWINPVFLKFI